MAALRFYYYFVVLYKVIQILFYEVNKNDFYSKFRIILIIGNRELLALNLRTFRYYFEDDYKIKFTQLIDAKPTIITKIFRIQSK